MINKHYEKSISGTQEDFIDFIKKNNPNITDEDIINNIDFLAQRVALNLFYFEDNLSTAKSDYIYLLGLLIKKGVIFDSEQNKQNKVNVELPTEEEVTELAFDLGYGIDINTPKSEIAEYTAFCNGIMAGAKHIINKLNSKSEPTKFFCDDENIHPDSRCGSQCDRCKTQTYKDTK